MGSKGFWPEVVQDANEAYGYNDEPTRTRPTSEQITRYDFVSLWPRCLDREEATILWAWAKGIPSKVIEREHSYGRTKLNKTINMAVRVIATMLNMGSDFGIMLSAQMCAQENGCAHNFVPNN